MKDWQKIEAVLFASGKYLDEDKISELSGVAKKSLKHAFDDLVKHYSSIESSLKVFNEGKTWKLNVKEDFTDIIKNIVSEAEMPRPVMETLAIIAYKNPVLQSDVIDARGSGAYEHIGVLEDKGFVTKEKHGRTYKLRVTDKFYEYFDVEGDSKLSELFKDIKKPEQLSNLEVYDEAEKPEEKDDDFTDKILDRMKKLETKPHEKSANDDFLKDIDSKIDSAKSRIDTAEDDLKEYKRDDAEPSEAEENVEQILEKVNKEIDDLSEESITPEDVEEVRNEAKPKENSEEFAEKQYVDDEEVADSSNKS